MFCTFLGESANPTGKTVYLSIFNNAKYLKSQQRPQAMCLSLGWNVFNVSMGWKDPKSEQGLKQVSACVCI